MNWSKAKTVLIVFFTIVNLFLLYTIISRNINNYYISKETVSNTVEVLNNNGIKINKDIIPRKNIVLDQYEVYNIIVDYDEFAKTILGDNPNKLSDALYSNEKGTLEFKGDKFIYTTTFNGNTSLNENNIISILNNIGINISDYSYSNGIFKKKINDIGVYDCELSVKFINNNQMTISGVWFEKKSDKIQNQSELKPITTALIDMLSSPNRPKKNIEISGVELGYMVYETETFHKSVVLIPAWKISFSDNGYICLDARSNG